MHKSAHLALLLVVVVASIGCGKGLKETRELVDHLGAHELPLREPQGGIADKLLNLQSAASTLNLSSKPQVSILETGAGTLLTIMRFDSLEAAQEMHKIIAGQIAKQSVLDRLREVLGERHVVTTRNLVVEIRYRKDQAAQKDALTSLIQDF